MTVNSVAQEAFHAVRAARLEHTIGARMARLYARRNGAFRLYLLARMLEREED